MRFISAVIAALVAGGTVRADMIPVSGQRDGGRQTMPVDGRPDTSSAKAAGLFSGRAIAELDLFPDGFPADPQGDVEPPAELQSVYLLSDEQDSLDLCLYALFGLGLCRSPHWVKKFSFGVIPHWYHDGGPFQIGHSHAISPDCLCSAPAHCFVQPDCRRQMPMLQYRQKTIMALWRKSQFVPTILASRGPPSCSWESGPDL